MSGYVVFASDHPVRLHWTALDGASLVQRRAHPRARLPFGFHTAIHLTADRARYFLAHPLDLGAGGVRMLHRLPLSPGDTFRLIFRPRAGITITLSATVIESQQVVSSRRSAARPTYATRAKFFDVTDMQRKFLSRYVGWLLTSRN